jgi:hypothetical protein
MIVVFGNRILLQTKLNSADKSRQDSPQLQVRELQVIINICVDSFWVSETYLLADTSMPAGPERLVRAFRAFADGAEPVVDLLATFIRICVVCLRRRALRVTPTCWVPFCRLLPYSGVDLTDSRACQYKVASGHDVGAILRGCR